MEPCKESSWRAKSKDGYYRIYAPKYGESYLHRYLYAKHHDIELNPTDVIRHLCNNRSCIEITHLALGTQSENIQDSVQAGTNPLTKLTKKDVLQIRKLWREGKITKGEIAREFEISQRHLNDVIANKYWKESEIM